MPNYRLAFALLSIAITILAGLAVFGLITATNTQKDLDFTTCIAKEGGYQSRSIEEAIEIREQCE